MIEFFYFMFEFRYRTFILHVYYTICYSYGCCNLFRIDLYIFEEKNEFNIIYLLPEQPKSV